MRLPLLPTLFAAALAVWALSCSALADSAAPYTQPAPAARRSPSSPSTSSTQPTASTPSTELNLRQLGAIGDNQPHPVREWIAQKKYKNLRDIQRDYPFVTSLDWSIDETVFQRALHDLPPEGGTIRIPAGRYIATAHGWRIGRDHVRLSGAGMRDTMLSTGPTLADGLVLALLKPEPGNSGPEYPLSPDTCAAGTDRLRLSDPTRIADFKAGTLVYIATGSTGPGRDYGEINEIASTTPSGELILAHPLTRDYARAVLRVEGTTRGFSASGLRIYGRLTALDLSNSYESTFTDCDFVRQPAAATQEGLTLNACRGRFASFYRCSFRTQQPAPTRIAHSFGDITFTACTFVGTAIAMHDFSFGVALAGCALQTPSPLGAAFRFDRAVGDLRVENCKIIVTGGTLSVFEATDAVLPLAQVRPARLILRDNRITGPGTLRPTVFRIRSLTTTDISGNTLNSAPVEPPRQTSP